MDTGAEEEGEDEMELAQGDIIDDLPDRRIGADRFVCLTGLRQEVADVDEQNSCDGDAADDVDRDDAVSRAGLLRPVGVRVRGRVRLFVAHAGPRYQTRSVADQKWRAA